MLTSMLTSDRFMRQVVSRTLTANIRRRRGSKVAINLPIYIDRRTPRPFVDPTIPWHRDVFPEDAGAPHGSMASFREKVNITCYILLLQPMHGAALIDPIYLDAMGLVLSFCCVQLTL